MTRPGGAVFAALTSVGIGLRRWRYAVADWWRLPDADEDDPCGEWCGFCDDVEARQAWMNHRKATSPRR